MVQLTLSPDHWLLQLEVRGNQRFIFDTNKLRLNIGASQLLYAATQDWVHESVAVESETATVDILLSTSGRALLATTDPEVLRRILRRVSHRALEEAPGLNITGSITRLGDHKEKTPGASATRLGRALRSMSAENERLAGLIPAGGARFAQLPILEVCGLSGFPVERTVHIEADRRRVSEVTYRKDAASKKGHARIGRQFFGETGDEEVGAGRVRDLNTLEDTIREGSDVGWLALVAIDGSGIGGLFIDLADRAAAENSGANDDALDLIHLERMSRLSRTLTEASDVALREALASVDNSAQLAIPIVAGGDDIAILCAAHVACPLTEAYLSGFEQATSGLDPDLLSGRKRLSACAGIAVIKPHFPFHAAHSLAEELLSSAKEAAKSAVAGTVGEPIPSAIDIHVLADSVFTGLETIRQFRVSRDRESVIDLWGGPYLAGQACADQTVAANFRTMAWLHEQLGQLREESDGRFNVPRSRLHRLRFAMGESLTTAQAELEQWRDGVPDHELLGGTDGELAVLLRGRLSNALYDLLDFVDALAAPRASEEAR